MKAAWLSPIRFLSPRSGIESMADIYGKVLRGQFLLSKAARVQVGYLKDVGDELWQRGGTVHDRAGGAARAWGCGRAEGPLLALLSDARQASDFVSDRRTLFPDVPVHFLNELPLTVQTIGSRPLLLQRGETIQRWVREGGVLVCTPGAGFGPSGEGYVRFTAFGSEEDTTEALEHLQGLSL